MANSVKIKVSGLALLVVLGLSGCGQKRALYLPEEPATNASTPDSPVTSESADQGKQ